MNRTEALDAAKAAVTNRPNAYGPPEQNFARIAALWSAYLVGKAPGTDAAQPVTAIDVAAMMALMKIARIEETPSHADSWVDLAGYAACGAEVSAGPSAGVFVPMSGEELARKMDDETQRLREQAFADIRWRGPTPSPRT